MQLPKYNLDYVYPKTGGRGYSVDGRSIPGVTTVLRETKPEEDKKFLDQWQANNPKKSKDGLTRGAIVHEAIEAYLNGEPIPEQAKPYYDYLRSFKPVLELIDETLLVEGCVWNPRGYAGKIDSVIQWNGEWVLCDWKTSKAYKSSRDVWDYKLQIAAYCGAFNHVYHDFGITLNRGMIVIGVPGQECQVFHITPQKLMGYWDAWLVRLEMFHKRYNLNKQ